MVYVNVDFPEDMHKSLKIYAAKKEIKNLSDAVIELVKKVL